MRQSRVIAPRRFGRAIMSRLQTLRIGWIAQHDVAVLQRQPGVREHSFYGGPHLLDTVRRARRDFVQQIGDVERPDVDQGAVVQRLAADQQGVTQGVAGFFVFEAGSGAGDVGLGGLQEGQGAGCAAFGGVDALGDLRGRSTGFLASLGKPDGGIRAEPELLAPAADDGAIDPRAAQAACARAHQHDQAVGGGIGVFARPRACRRRGRSNRFVVTRSFWRASWRAWITDYVRPSVTAHRSD